MAERSLGDTTANAAVQPVLAVTPRPIPITTPPAPPLAVNLTLTYCSLTVTESPPPALVRLSSLSQQRRTGAVV